MLLLLQLGWSWAAAAVVVVVVVVAVGVGFELLLSRGPGSPEVLPCSAWAICGVVGEHAHVSAQGHSVAGSGWAVFLCYCSFLGKWKNIRIAYIWFYGVGHMWCCW